MFPKKRQWKDVFYLPNKDGRELKLVDLVFADFWSHSRKTYNYA